MADYETQVVVIAGGPSGLSAAVQAAEDGAEVIVLDKASAVGGAANLVMGPLGIFLEASAISWDSRTFL